MHVTLYLDADQDFYHTSYVHTGIFGLAGRRQIDLEVMNAPIGSWRRPAPGSPCAYFDIERGTDSIAVAIDLRDKSDVFDEAALEQCDVYFKRSYFAPDVHRLAPRAGMKVVPFGLNFVCANVPSALAIGMYLGREMMSAVAGGRASIARVRALATKAYDYWRYRTERDYLADAETPKQPVIVFQTRVWEKHEVIGDNAAEINEQRVQLVKALQDELGSRFVGGLVPTPLAMREYPALVTANPIAPASFARWQRTMLIGIYTRGLHHSTAWKLGEYLAGSMCIIAEPPRNELPVPLRSGDEYIGFGSTAECLSACTSVIEQQALQRHLRQCASRYYEREVSPANHLLDCLTRAASHVQSRVA
jgi:hypothetical protein